MIYQVKMMRPEITGNDIFDNSIKILYTYLDPTGLNCFPSIHAIIGIMTAIASYKNKVFPKWMQIIGILIGIGCAISTVFVKQHYFLDLLAGTIIAILVYSLVNIIDNKLIKKAN